MSELLAFHVVGIPATAGSKTMGRTKDGRMFIRDDTGQRGKAWRKVVQAVAREAMGGRSPMTGPLRVVMIFALPRPATHRLARGLRPDAPKYPVTRPDALKLARAVEDALTGVVWADDGQIVDEMLAKHYGDPTGVVVTVEEMG